MRVSMEEGKMVRASAAELFSDKEEDVDGYLFRGTFRKREEDASEDITFFEPRWKYANTHEPMSELTVPATDIDEIYSLRHCAACGAVSTTRCPHCRLPYCNCCCQQNDWQRHKAHCNILQRAQRDLQTRRLEYKTIFVMRNGGYAFG